MGAREGMIVGSVLLAICFLASTAPRALEPVQPGMSVGASSALPDFLDDDRLPALQEAWRSGDGRSETALSAPQSALPVAMPSAIGAASVRERAEELSRRFGATTGAAPQTEPRSVTIPPAVVPEAAPDSEQTAAPSVMPPRKSAVQTAKTSANAPYPTETASTQKDFTADKLRLAAPPPPPERLPPLPRRAPESRSVSLAPTKAVVARPRAARTYDTYSEAPRAKPAVPPGDPKAALRGTILTNELHSFGWNSQPK
jgi:hypothetical protein